MKTLTMVAAAALLMACSGPSARLDMSPVQSSLQLRAAVSSAMVRTVSLPSYAAAEEVAIQTPDGLIGTTADVLWADDPERAVTLAVSLHLDTILGATVGPDPWPFAGLPDVSIDVRVTQMLAGADNVFRLAGQYYVGGDGIDYRNISRSFTLENALEGEGPAAIANAQARAILALSELIARDLAR